ncbi:MAG: hypothetical protein H6Q89_1989 [Myxococcaceae bacterium]|nr:hypothetical protein [Myxococcaceae bacterium]
MADEQQRFGKYVLISKLAAGGMAVTYRAKMTAAAGLTKDVVIKKIHPHLAEEEDFVEMFIREAKLAASLTHGNIAQVFDFGKTEGDYFLAMELVHGQALSRVLRRAGDNDIPFLPIPIALQIVCRMCDGLNYAHTRKDENGHPLNLVHRDVSPENLLLSYEGEVKVVDFGIAKSNTGGKQTETGMVKGKYPYFSPEQAQAARDLDARSDVYAVGVVLFEMLCGRRPYEGEFVAVLTQLAEGNIPRPRSFNSEISAALELTMLKALATRREDRYQSARELGQALSEVLHSRYPGSTSNDISMLLATLFREELEAEGNATQVTAEFTTALTRLKQPGYGAERKARLGQKPDSKATPKPLTAPGAKSATPARARTTTGTGSAKVPSPTSNAHGGYRPRSMPAMPAIVEKPSGTRLEPIEQETLLRAKAAKAKAAAAPPDDRTPVPTAPERPVISQSRRPSAPLSLDNAELREKRQRFVVTIGGVGAGLSVLLVVGFLIFGGKEPEEVVVNANTPLWISSIPEGANVKVDNRDLGPSPVKTAVAPGPHTMAITKPGFRPWTKRFTATKDVINLTAKLDADVKEEPKVEAVFDAGSEAEQTERMQDTGVTSAEKRDVRWPLRLFVLRPAYNALPIDKYETANLELSPGTAYQVGTEGSYSLGRGRTSATVLYYLEGDIPEGKRVGYLTAQSKTIKGATRIYAFVLDDDASDNSGSMKITFRISQYIVPKTLVFEAEKHAIVPLPDHRFRLAKLKPLSKYQLTIRNDEAVTGTGKTGRVGSVLCLENPVKNKPVTATHRLLEVGKRHKVTDTDSLICTFPDLNPEDNSGSLEIDIVDMDELSPEEQLKADKEGK